MRHIPIRLLVVVFLMSLGLAGACDSDSGGGGGGGGGSAEVGQTYTATLTAAEGGTLATPSGAATLAVPAGALAVDTELTVTVAAKTADTAGEVYDFGPDGLQFAAPVTLSIAYAGAPGEGKKAVIGWLDGSTWTEVAGSTVAGGKVSAPVTHFSQFSVIITATGVEQPSACGDIAAAFTACGGDLVGTWTIDTMCMYFDPNDNPFSGNDGPFGECPDMVYSLGMDWIGTYTLDGTNLTASLTGTVMSTRVDIPLSCFPEGWTCASFGAGDDELDCAEEGATCRCNAEESRNEPAEFTQTYTVAGSLMTITDEDGDQTRVDYCVQGDTATMHVLADEPRRSGSMEWFVLKKQ
jgi:hypothetical protein